jgi:hypothetical protein
MWPKQPKYGHYIILSTNAGIAQLVEQLICNQQVIGSNPIAGSAAPRADPRAIRPSQKSLQKPITCQSFATF